MYYADKPIERVEDDSLGRSSFAKTLAHTLFNLKNTDTFTVGLYGKWGSGKTSIVNMTLQELSKLQAESREKAVIIRFEPWHFFDSSQLLNQFIIRLASEFSNKKDKAMYTVGQALEKYSGAFSLAELIPIYGTSIANVGKMAFSRLGKHIQNDIGSKDVLQQKAQVIKLLEKEKTKILVVIDDIDRLPDEQIRMIFQLVSAVATFPNTTYLLVFDKDIAVKALNKLHEDKGEDYLHKIIQMPIQIPDIKEAEFNKVLFKNLDKTIEKLNVPFQAERWKDIFPTCVAPFISNLRDVKRLLNSLNFKLPTISSEIEFSDMVAICAIEIGAPKIFEWIKTRKNILVGNPDVNFWNTQNNKQPDWLQLYTEEIAPLVDNNVQAKGYAKNKTETVLNALSYLFPSFGGKIGKGGFALTSAIARKNCYICNIDKFDRYFDFDIDNIFVTRAVVETVVFSYELADLESYLLAENQTYEILEEIRAILPDIPPIRLAVIFLALMNVMNALDSKKRPGFLDHSTHISAEHLTLEILNSISPSERLDFFIKALKSCSNIAIEAFAKVINVVELAHGKLAAKGTQGSELEKIFSVVELENIEKAFVERCKAILKDENLFNLPGWRMTLHLLKSFDRDFVDDYMSKAMQLDKNVVIYIRDLSSTWVGSGISYEIKVAPYDYVTKERIVEAIESMLKSGELFALGQDIQERAAAFYLNHLGKTSYSNHITQKSTIAFLEKHKLN